jgi:hypothetical protein
VTAWLEVFDSVRVQLEVPPSSEMDAVAQASVTVGAASGVDSGAASASAPDVDAEAVTDGGDYPDLGLTPHSGGYGSP